jgi:hypothetical protein
MSTECCDTCKAYRRGERDDIVTAFGVIHVCEAHVEGTWFGACPCGCAKREIGVVGRDRAIFGNAFLGPRGERIDPTTVTAAS